MIRPLTDHRFFLRGLVSTLLLASAVSAQPSAPLPLPADQLAEGWVSLFDGQTLFGWKPAGEVDWQVSDRTITCTQGDASLLRTTTQFSDFQLQLEFSAESTTNSGVFLRTAPQPHDPKVDCYEINIAPADNPFPTGSIVGRSKTTQFAHTKDWHELEMIADRGEIEVRIDGTTVCTYTDPRPLGRGYIGLQHNQGSVAFRKIRLKPLGLQSLFNGRDLAGWKTYKAMASRFTVTDAGELNVKDGRGQLESVGEFADFVLQFECQTHAAHLNSGIFFRCLPGLEMMGYECQIHNGFQDNDRRRPIDCGTGGIFRRQNARWVLASDNEWFSVTLIAEGPHMAAWVNGVQVSDWTDTRPPQENPRKGLRLEPGTLMIQGHDPTTNISFRHLRAAEMTPRR